MYSDRAIPVNGPFVIKNDDVNIFGFVAFNCIDLFSLHDAGAVVVVMIMVAVVLTRGTLVSTTF